MLTAFLFGFPILVAVAWIVLLLRARLGGLWAGQFMCAATFAAGYWSIRQSRASTAGIGFVFLPGVAALSGSLALVFGRLGRDPRVGFRIAGWLCLLASVGLGGWLYAAGFQERAKNDARDRRAAENARAIERNRIAIARIVQEHVGNETAALDAEIETHGSDRTFLIPALETSFVSEDRLDRLSSNADLGVVLGVSRNPRTRADTLERIYRASSYPPYFFDALAAHKNTPVEILRTLAVHPEPLASVDRSLARNPAAPRDVLDGIVERGDPFALRNLLQNTALDCTLLRRVASLLGPVDRIRVQASDETIASLEAKLCVRK